MAGREFSKEVERVEVIAGVRVAVGQTIAHCLGYVPSAEKEASTSWGSATVVFLDYFPE